MSFFNKDISQIHFEYEKFGKPYLKGHDISFNISHSQNLAIIALSKNIEIGVDIEFIDYQLDYLPLLEYFASDSEIAWVKEENAIRRFYQLWTTKEAILKCSGVGMMDFKFPELIIQRNDLLYYGGKIINLQYYNYEYYISAFIAGEDD